MNDLESSNDNKLLNDDLISNDLEWKTGLKCVVLCLSYVIKELAVRKLKQTIMKQKTWLKMSAVENKQ